jgi:hypothetical protein
MTAHEDPLGVVFGGLGLGLTLGLALQSLVAFAVRSVQLAQPVAPGPPDFATPAALILLGGTLAASLAAAAATWMALAPLQNPYRQGMLALVAAFGALALALVAMPVDRLLGRLGLLGLALFAGATAFFIRRRMRALSR